MPGIISRCSAVYVAMQRGVRSLHGDVASCSGLGAKARVPGIFSGCFAESIRKHICKVGAQRNQV